MHQTSGLEPPKPKKQNTAFILLVVFLISVDIYQRLYKDAQIGEEAIRDTRVKIFYFEKNYFCDFWK